MFKKENLRKNFLRVKQNIDQNLGRAEKSEVLSEDQQENEKRVDVVKHAFQSIAKKAGGMLEAPGMEYDKRLKKMPETGLGTAMLESAQVLGPETLLGSVCKMCGDCQIDLAKEEVEYEITVEQDFVAPLQQIVDVDIPSIIKLKKNLNKSTLDMDSAKSRFNQAVRQSHVPGANMANAAAKADVIREEFEDAAQKVESIKDNLSIELCNFASKEYEQSSRLLGLLKAQANFHRKALETIESCIPQMEVAIKNSPAKPCYGMPLEEHLNVMCRDIAVVLEACILTLLDTGMEEEGLFRIAGAAVKLKKLKAAFDANAVDMEDFSTDPHTIAGSLKQYLRELPEPLLTYALYNEFMQAASLPQDQRLQTLWTVINKLPKANYNNFRYLIKFLAKLAEKSDINKMKPSNIAIVIGPNLMWVEDNNAPNMLTTGTVSAIIEAIVTHADWFFPGADFDFHLTGHGSSPVKCRQPGYPLESMAVSQQTPSSVAKNIEKMVNKHDKIIKVNKVDNVKHSDGALLKSTELQIQKPKTMSDDDSSSDESNPFSSKYSPICERDSRRGNGQATKKDDLLSVPSVQYGNRYGGKCVAPNGTNTGDYDNVLYTINPHQPNTMSSSMHNKGPHWDRGLGYRDLGDMSDPTPPARPTRMSKKYSNMTPVKIDPSYSDANRKPSYPDTLDPYYMGSTPNISSLNRSTSDAHLYPGLPMYGPYWNRPNQKSNFSSLKRGSDPCLALPTNCPTLSNQRPLQISRSQLGPPPLPVSVDRSKQGKEHDKQPGDYSSQMRVMWDPQQNMPPHSRYQPAQSTENLTLRDLAMAGQAGSSYAGAKQTKPPSGQAGARDRYEGQWKYPILTSELDFNNVGYQYEEEADRLGQQSAVYRSTSQPNSTNEPLHVQVNTNQGMVHYSSPGMSPASSTNLSTSLSVPSESSSVASPIQRRPTRKPAPPPPPERPFNVTVTATATAGKPGNPSNGSPGGSSDQSDSSSSQSNKTAPLASPESIIEPHLAVGLHDRGERQRTSYHGGDRPAIPPPDKPERPRLPPALNPAPGNNKGHQRSASTGAMLHQPSSYIGFEGVAAGVPNAGSLNFPAVIEGGEQKRSGATNQGSGIDTTSSATSPNSSLIPGSSSTLGRHSSMRPRPSPPPPPPPIARQSEDTKL